MKKLILALLSPLFAGCLGIPDGIEPVTGFELEPYLGQWYEIARLDHRFEKGMDHVTAEYSLRDDGGIAVLNKGFVVKSKKWKTASGKAFLVNRTDVGHLKVSFFGPFYGSYIIFDLDPEKHAYVCGPDRSYLWFLSRTPTVSEDQKEHFTLLAKKLGFDTENLIWVDQDAESGPNGLLH